MEKNIKAFNRINTITSAHFDTEKELVKRVQFVKQVIVNTLHKFPRELWPEELEWARKGGRYTGFEFRDYNDKVVEITGDKPLGHNHHISFYIIGTKGWSSKELTVQRASFPAALLFNDPMAIAQYARKLIRNKQYQIRVKTTAEANKKVDEVNKKIAELEAERTKLEQQRIAIRKDNEKVRENLEKNRAKVEARRAAKLQKSNS